jgi:hypothetical protein
MEILKALRQWYEIGWILADHLVAQCRLTPRELQQGIPLLFSQSLRAGLCHIARGEQKTVAHNENHCASQSQQE